MAAREEHLEAILRDVEKVRRWAAGEDIPELRADFPHGDVVAAIRETTGLSQAAFYHQIEVPIATLRDWEQGRRWPNGPALVLLALLAKDPEIVRRTLSEAA